MREICMSGSMSGMWKRVMVEPLRHRQTKEAATDMFDLQPPRHISTLHYPAVRRGTASGPLLKVLRTIRARPQYRRPSPVADLRALLDCGVAVFGDLRQAAVMPSPYATNKASLIEMLTYCRAR